MSSSSTTPAVSSPNLNPNVSTHGSSMRSTKRKLDDAFRSLDDAVGSPDRVERPSPAKKFHPARSFYSTLSKYGINPKDSKPSTSANKFEMLSKGTPHLTAILTRAATRTRKALPLKFAGHSPNSTPLPSTAEYRPSSTPSFLSRLATFKLATYGNKPTAIDAVAASKCGWTNDGKDRLVCGVCNASWVVTGRDGLNRDAANSLIEKQRASLVEMHKNGCPWKTRQCDPSVYRIPLQSPAVTVREIKINALKLKPVLEGVEIKHPLTLTQLNSLRSAVSSFPLSTSTLSEDLESPDGSSLMQTPPTAEPSETAILTALFGWTLVAPTPRRSRPSSLSRANSVFSAAPPTPSISRASSVTFSRNPTPSPDVPRPVRLASDSFDKASTRDTHLLHCTLCLRRVGLWAFAPQHLPLPQNDQDPATVPERPTPFHRSLPRAVQRPFDVLKEHRSYCPYVVRSTIVPSLLISLPSGPTPNGHIRSNSSVSQLNGQNGALEGWRAVLTVVLRYGMVQRRRFGPSSSSLERSEANESGRATRPEEVTGFDGVEAMMEGVKRRGGKELLNYVKGLLG